MKYNLTKSMGSLIATAETESATALTNTTTRTIKTAVATKTQQQMTPPRNCRSLKNSGFTIIEVALVLAIAGLIFLVVFLALPALQNSQKDTARKQDVGRVVSALQAYEADNGGNPPVAGNSNYTGFSSYLGTLSQAIYVYVAPSGTPYYADPTSYHSVVVILGMQCNGNAATSASDAAVTVTLSSGTVYCASM